MFESSRKCERESDGLSTSAQPFGSDWADTRPSSTPRLAAMASAAHVSPTSCMVRFCRPCGSASAASAMPSVTEPVARRPVAPATSMTKGGEARMGCLDASLSAGMPTVITSGSEMA